MSIKIKIPKYLPKERVSVVKVVCGDKFFISKTSDIEWFASSIKKNYGKYAYRNGIRADNMFYPLVKFMHKESITTLHIDIIFSSNDGYRILQRELELLQEHYGTKKCLNKNMHPLVPKTSYNEANKHKWLTLNQSLNYYKLLKKTLQ